MSTKPKFDALERTAAVRENERMRIVKVLEEFRDLHWREYGVNEVISQIIKII